jgi:tetratricopeptide (TPR) repeat protein
MSAISVGTPLWQSLWVKAREAREIGAIGRTLTFFGQTLAEDPPAAEPYAEAADFAVQIEHSLAPLEGLYEQYHAAFNLSPGAISFRTRDLPINGDGLRQSVGWLEIAAGRDQTNPIHLERLAEVLEELGRLEAALACRRRMARRFPTIEANHWAIALLLERTGTTSEALSYCEGLLAGRAMVEPTPALCLARLYERAGRHEEVKLLGEHLTDAIAAAGPGASAMLFRFAWSAANDGLPTVSEWPRTLLLQAIAIAHLPEASIEAQLAAGLAASIFGDEDSSREHFAAACWKTYEQSTVLAPPNASHELRHALNYAARKILDLVPSLSVKNGPPVAIRHLLLACSHYLRKESSVTENLARFDTTFAAIFNLSKDNPFKLPDSDVYRGYRIVAFGGQYYAIPLGRTDYTILSGAVYRVPEKVLTVMRLCPPRLRQGLRGALARCMGREPGTGAGTGAPSAAHSAAPARRKTTRVIPSLVTRVLALFAVHDALKTTDVLALYREIDATVRTWRRTR